MEGVEGVLVNMRIGWRSDKIVVLEEIILELGLPSFGYCFGEERVLTLRGSLCILGIGLVIIYYRKEKSRFLVRLVIIREI